MADNYDFDEDLKDRFKDNIDSNYAEKVNTANQAAKNSAEHVATGADALGGLASQANNNTENVSEAAKEAGEAAKEAGKEAGKEVAKEAATEAGEAAATGGTSLIKTAVKIIARKTAGEISSIGQKGDIDSDYKAVKSLAVILAPILLIIFLIFWGTFYLKEVVGGVKNYSGKSFDDEIVIEEMQGNIEKDFSDEELRKYYSMQEEEIAPLKDAVDVYINGNNDGKGLKNALHDAITVECKDIVDNLGNKLMHVGFFELVNRLIYGYDKEKSLNHFRSLYWPYDLIKDGQNTTIGAVLDGNYTPLYDDTNFLEMLTILCQNENYDWENCKYTDFNEYIRTKKAQNLYYELEVKYVIEYFYYEDVEHEDTLNGGTYWTRELVGPLEDGEEYDTFEELKSAINVAKDSKKYIDGHECTPEGFYIKTNVKPFGLRELYMMAEVNPTDYHRDWDHHTYSQLLDRTEKLTHTYLRKDAAIAGVYYKDTRTVKSTIYEDLMAKFGEATGRSAWCYIDNPFNLQNYGGFMPYEIPPEIIESMIDFENLPEGANSLENFLTYFYHNQGNIQNLNGQVGLCNFTSYMMIAMYYNNITMTDQQLADIASQNCDNNGFFRNQASIMNQYNLGRSDIIYNDIPNAIASSIDRGHPLVLHCEGYWVDPVSNKALHGKPGNTSGHFMVVYGYNKDGIKVADPGMSSNNSTTISWQSLAMSNDIHVREMYPTS